VSTNFLCVPISWQNCCLLPWCHSAKFCVSQWFPRSCSIAGRGATMQTVLPPPRCGLMLNRCSTCCCWRRVWSHKIVLRQSSLSRVNGQWRPLNRAVCWRSRGKHCLLYGGVFVACVVFKSPPQCPTLTSLSSLVSLCDISLSVVRYRQQFMHCARLGEENITL